MLNNKMSLLEKWKGIGEQMELGQNNDAKFLFKFTPSSPHAHFPHLCHIRKHYTEFI